MTGFAIVRRVDRVSRRADVVVYPASCGRCEDDGGHCTRDHRVVPAWVPEGLVVRPGDHVKLITSPTAAVRGIVRLFVAPVVGGVAGLFLGGVHLSDLLPRAAAQLGGTSAISLGIPGLAIVLAAGGVVVPILLALYRGVRPEDWPTVSVDQSPEAGDAVAATAVDPVLHPIVIDPDGILTPGG